MRLLLVVTGSLMLSAFAAFAQNAGGTITGTVSDPAGAVVPNAMVQVKNVDTNTVYQGGTSATGNFVIQVPVGKYELTVTSAGFKKFVRENLVVTVATDVRQDVALEVGANSETVTVNAEAPLLKTESGELSHNVTVDDADNLPVLALTAGNSFGSNGFGNIRDPLAVSQLLPGVVYAVDGGISVNGLPASTEAIRVEGQDATNGAWNQKTQINQSGMDAIQEVSIQTSNFAAEYGQAGGGYFNYTMKSGTNTLHGSTYMYWVNEALNAGLPFTNAGLTNSLKDGEHIRDPDRKFDFGGTLGGPVKIPKIYDGRDKTFFFFNFERYQETQAFTQTETVPTLAYRSGNFSAATNPFGFPLALSSAGFFGPPTLDALGRPMFYDEVYDPNSTKTLASGAIVRDPFPGGIIPAARFNPIAMALQNLIPLPNAPGVLNNYNLPQYQNYQHTTNWSIKGDHSFSPTIKISAYVSHILTFNPNKNGIPGPVIQPSETNNRSTTVRVNYDQTIRPTLLLHLGIGYLYTYIPSGSPNYNEASLGLTGYPVENYFPNFSGLSDFFSGGVGIGGGLFGGGGLGPAGFLQNLWDEKPTGNTYVTWVKGNHTFKFGGEFMAEGFPDIGVNRANGNFGISQTETGNPNEQAVGLSSPFTTGLTGFGYASFLLGQVDNLNINPPTQSKLGYHSFGLYAQDSWKVTRKLTVDYGLRYDFQTYLKEQYGRMPNTVFNVTNPETGTPGATLFEGYGGGRCNCQFSHNYPYGFGPRLGVAYQIAPKTVLRGGAGLLYTPAPNNAFLSYNDTVFYAVSGPSYGLPFMTLGPNPYAPGNPFGNPPLKYPNFDEGIFPVPTGGVLPPDSPFINIDRSSRPGRILNWSVGLQREITPNLVAEATYVGNRGVWLTAPELDATDYNALTPQQLLADGINIQNPADRALLLQPINSPAVIARYPYLANPNNVYPGFPASQPLNQVFRLAPEFLGVPPFLGPPLGNTWYDALQVKVTKRFSHGLSIQGSYTFSKNDVLGVSASTQYFTPGTPLINDVYNRDQNKQLSQNTAPSLLVISGQYVTPRVGQSRLLKNVLGGWQIATLLRYQNGALIQSPSSVNNLLTQLDRGPSNNPALWGGGYTFFNPIAGQSCLAINPNQKGFDPTKTLALNTNAWVDPGGGNFGTAAPFYNNCRWQRYPAENMSFGRNFRIKERANLQFRVEFQNIFNRLFYSEPSLAGGTNPTTPAVHNNPNGGLSGGYGYVNYVNGGCEQPGGAGAGGLFMAAFGTNAGCPGPRTGQAVIRLTF